MKVLLADENPHPFPGAKEHVYADWWGREIELGTPKAPELPMPCGTRVIWPIVGPYEFVKALRNNKLGMFACVHCIGEELR